MPIKTRKIDSALISKGFVKNEKKKHIFYFLYIDGKKTQIRTKLSHGSNEYNDSLLSAIRKQLKFNNKEELEEFIECTKSLEQYIKRLESKSII